MEELTIKVMIGGRTYPLTIKREDEEIVRKAAKMIEEKIRDFELNYSVSDKQDLLAMCALQHANQIITAEEKGEPDEVEQAIKQLELTTGLIEDYLQKV
jgi:cell division protein ZapA (FtsZ GTPase activity inhibitor)